MEPVNLAAVNRAWAGVTRAIGVSSIDTEADYERALAAMEAMIEAVRGEDRHPLHGAIAWLAKLIEDYESTAHPVAVLTGPEFLRALMTERKLRQSDLPEIGTQSVVSEILRGKRRLNARQIASLAKRFRVSADVFLN